MTLSSQNFDFLGLKHLSPVQFWGAAKLDFIMKRYGNYGEGGEGGGGGWSQVIPLCNAGKKFHMTHLSAVVAFCT